MRPNPNVATLFTKNEDGSLVISPSVLVSTIVDDPNNSFLVRIRSATSQCIELEQFLNGEFSDDWTLDANIIFFHDLVFLPTDELRTEAIKDAHCTLTTGHFGINKTVELISRNFYWNGIRRSVTRYIRSCDTCSRAKADRSAPYGLLHPLPVPENRWADVSIDFITDLPSSGANEFDSICMVKCRLTKLAHFIPTHKAIDASGTAKLFIANVFRLHGFPSTITSDRGPQFVSVFWNEFLRQMKCSRNLTSAYHPQSNASAEVTNQVVEQYLRVFCNYEQSDWSDLLSLAEFAYNNTLNSTT
jgi:hypothetical protein